MDLIVLILATLALYIFLRSYGGKGVGIKGKFAPSSTVKGKRDRIFAFSLVALAIAAAIYAFFYTQENDRWFIIAIPFLVGALAYLVSYSRNKK